LPTKLNVWLTGQKARKMQNFFNDHDVFTRSRALQSIPNINQPVIHSQINTEHELSCPSIAFLDEHRIVFASTSSICNIFDTNTMSTASVPNYSFVINMINVGSRYVVFVISNGYALYDTVEQLVMDVLHLEQYEMCFNVILAVGECHFLGLRAANATTCNDVIYICHVKNGLVGEFKIIEDPSCMVAMSDRKVWVGNIFGKLACYNLEDGTCSDYFDLCNEEIHVMHRRDERVIIVKSGIDTCIAVDVITKTRLWVAEGRPFIHDWLISFNDNRQVTLLNGRTGEQTNLPMLSDSISSAYLWEERGSLVCTHTNGFFEMYEIFTQKPILSSVIWGKLRRHHYTDVSFNFVNEK
jgi:hypothetical protein